VLQGRFAHIRPFFRRDGGSLLLNRRFQRVDSADNLTTPGSPSFAYFLR
jgi:hypothetical protein